MIKQIALRALLLSLSLLSFACSTAEPQVELPTAETGMFNRSLEHDGIEREYILYLPEGYTGQEEQKLPLLLNFHGFTGTSESQLSYADFRPIADRENFILVYPQGTLLGGDTHWNVGGWTRRSQTDDIGFTAALLDQLQADYAVDPTRIYSTGHSNGGYMSFQLACQLGDQIAAVASVSGSMTPEIMRDCEPTGPTSILQIHATADPTVPYSGTSWSESIDQVLAYWVLVNFADPSPAVETLLRHPETTASSSVEHIRHADGKNGTVVEHIRVIDGGHEWLGTPDLSGQVNLDYDTNEEIWAFLSRFDTSGLRN
ncbi:MAG: PHB depolymerase family esterase [Chloroflexota bacterium]